VESRRQRPPTSQRIKKKAKAKAKAESFVAALSLPNIAQLIEDGDITIGMLRPVGCVATAADEDCTYAMLVRRRGESLFQLFIRLDQAIDKALTLGIFTDEING
jgi:acetylglutamate kinase